MRLDVTMMMMVMFLLTILDQSTKIPTPFKMLIRPVQLTKILTPCKMLMRLDVTKMIGIVILTKIPTPFKMLMTPVQLTKIQTPCKMLMRLDVTKFIGLVISTKILTPYKMLMLDHFLRIMKMKNSILLKEKISYLNLKMIDKCNFF